MWLRDLGCLEVEYDKFISHRTVERGSESGKKKIVKKTTKCIIKSYNDNLIIFIYFNHVFGADSIHHLDIWF